MSNFRTLYARIVLRLIRPALEAQHAKNQDDSQFITDVMAKDLRENGPYARLSRRA